MNEKLRHRWAACEALALGRGGISAVAKASGLSRNTIRRGIEEIRTGMPQLARAIVDPASDRIRAPGAGRPRRVDEDESLVQDLEDLHSNR